jgi:hypothetical protein
MLSEQGVHVLSHNAFGLLPVTEGALMPEKQCDSCVALHLACLDFELSTPVYETYVLSMEEYRSGPGVDWLSAGFVSHSDGEVTVAVSHFPRDSDVKLPDGSELAYRNMWIGRIDADGKQLLSSTVITPAQLPPSPSHPLMIDAMLANPDKEMYLSGRSANVVEWQPDSLPPPWRTHLLFESKGFGGLRDRWILRLNANGEISTGLYLGSTNHAGHLPLIRNTTCDGMIMLNYDYPDNSLGHLVPTTILHPYNEVSLQDDGHQLRYIADIDDQLQVRYATNWNTAYHIPAAYGSQYYGLNGTIDRHGYLYLSFHHINPIFIRDRLVFHNSWRLPKLVPGEWPHVSDPLSFYDTYLTRFRLHTPCWLLGCGIAAVDTLRTEKRRAYAEPEEFELRFAVRNHSPEKGARILHALIELPAGFALAGGTPMQAMTPETLSPGMTAECSWTLRVADATLLGDTASVRCRVFYVEPESGQTWPPGEELCEHDIHILRFDEEDPELVCTVEGPEEAFWSETGYAMTQDGAAGPLRYTATFTNLENDAVEIAGFRFSVEEHATIEGNALRPGITLAPGASHVMTVLVQPARLLYGRTLRVQAEAIDDYDLAISSCAAETRLPDVTELPCSVQGPTRIVYNMASGMSEPAEAEYTLLLENVLDTLRLDMSCRAGPCGRTASRSRCGRDAGPRSLFHQPGFPARAELATGIGDDTGDGGLRYAVLPLCAGGDVLVLHAYRGNHRHR